MDFQLRTYAFIDSMQPQAAAHTAATCQGDVPIAGMAQLFIEVAPGNEIFRCADVALKAADVRPALQIVEREYGLLEVHARTQAEVVASGQAVLAYLGLSESDRLRPKVASAQFVTNVNPYQAQLINRWRKGNLLLQRSNAHRATPPLHHRDEVAGLPPAVRHAGARTTDLPPERSGILYRRGGYGLDGRRSLESGAARTPAAQARPTVAVIGAGHVGAATGIRLAESNVFERLV